MSKNKDPAVLFYTSDFLSGSADLSMTERGQYITLLCLQHQKGHLSRKIIGLSIPQVSADVLSKFEIDDKGKYFNRRMDEEIERRKSYSKSRARNRKNKESKKATLEEHMKNICNTYEATYEEHTENENINNTNNLSNTLNNIFPFSKTTTTTTVCDSAGARVCENVDNYDLINLEIMKYFAKMHYVSNALDFIAYNEARGWKGLAGEDVRADFERYADRWEENELRKKGLW